LGERSRTITFCGSSVPAEWATCISPKTLYWGRSIALKVLPSETSDFPDRMQRFVQEAKAASALNHPNIATIHELQETDGIHFIVMEYVEGETIKAKVARGPLDSSEIIRLAAQIAEALDAAHTIGIIHRDVKSANIMITPRGHAKVLDFGLAQRMAAHEQLGHASTSDATQSIAVMGTVPYMSPEQALGRRLDPARTCSVRE
jgi:eukaryotic-like serine/threonine-protein kinase